LAAIAFTGGQLGIWDWRRTNLIARLPVVEPRYNEATFDFLPDGVGVWLLATERLLALYDFGAGKPTRALTLDQAARGLRLSPSGRLAALICSNCVEVRELSSGAARSHLTLTNEIWQVAWQPGEERLALGCFGALYLWDIGSEKALLLEGGNIAIPRLFFNAEGSLLFVGGWNALGEIWGVRQRQRVLSGSLGWTSQLSGDETRAAAWEEKVGYGVREYFPPVGVRSWQAPPSLGAGRFAVDRGADVDPQERWVLTGHANGWLLRDAETGTELARELRPLIGPASFSADGSNVLGWVAEGLARWPLSWDGALRVGPLRLLECRIRQGLEVGCFCMSRRYAAICQDGQVTVMDLEHPDSQVLVKLAHRSDSSIYLSPDGQWLITGLHNQKGVDCYDAHAGRLVCRLATNGFAGPAFNPFNAQVFTCSASGYERWLLPEGKSVEVGPWSEPALAEGFAGFAPDGRLALVKSTASSFQLYDLAARRDFATLDFREPQPVFRCYWSRDSRRLFLFGVDGGVTRVDLHVLRQELGRLGLGQLDWPDENPSRELPVNQALSRADANQRVPTRLAQWRLWSLENPARLALIIGAGLFATIGIGLYILRYQRRLFTGYLETEALAAQHQVQLQQAQAALLHGEKMKALGTLSAGIAHDFNNLLSVIRLSNELIEEQVQPQGLAQENFEAIQHAVQRGRGIVNSMLGYARDDGQPRQFTASELISEAVALLGKSFLGGLVLQVEVQADTPALVARKGRLEQMLFNLIVNAAEAMRGHGTLTLSARRAREPGNCLLAPAAPGPGFVEIAVQDNGPGIAPEVLPRIFEPFFTTKIIGAKRGTGLGLSMVYTMAREDGIGIGVATEPGQGATFRLLIPVPADAGAGRSDGAGTFPGRDSPIAKE
jgi:signal transduction histidine kinase/WD40 repeat protein